MSGFPIDKYQVIWQKDATSESERQAILRELRQMAVELQETGRENDVLYLLCHTSIKYVTQYA